MAAHASFSPSAMGRLLECPGSWALCQQAPPEVESQYAQLGTDMHAQAERALNYWVESGELPSLPLDPAVQIYVDFVIEKAADAHLFVEQLVTLNSDVWGTLDSAILQPEDLWIVDYKNGSGVQVHPEENAQLLTYAGGILMHLKQHDIRIHLVIVQPNAPGEPVRIWETTVDRVLDHMGEIARMQKLARMEPAPLNSGEHCRFCDAKLMCPELKRLVNQSAEIEAAVAVQDLDRCYPMAQALRIWLNEVEKAAHLAAEEGHKFEGYKLVAKRGVRQHKDEEATKKWYHGSKLKGGIFERVMKSPAQLEKQFGKKNVPQDLFVSVSSGTTLVPESDKRSEIVDLERAAKALQANSLIEETK